MVKAHFSLSSIRDEQDLSTNSPDTVPKDCVCIYLEVSLWRISIIEHVAYLLLLRGCKYPSIESQNKQTTSPHQLPASFSAYPSQWLIQNRSYYRSGIAWAPTAIIYLHPSPSHPPPPYARGMHSSERGACRENPG